MSEDKLPDGVLSEQQFEKVLDRQPTPDLEDIEMVIDKREFAPCDFSQLCLCHGLTSMFCTLGFRAVTMDWIVKEAWREKQNRDEIQSALHLMQEATAKRSYETDEGVERASEGTFFNYVIYDDSKFGLVVRPGPAIFDFILTDYDTNLGETFRDSFNVCWIKNKFEEDKDRKIVASFPFEFDATHVAEGYNFETKEPDLSDFYFEDWVSGNES